MAWTKITDLLGAPRYGAIAFSSGTNGYVGLGRNKRIPIFYHKDLWEYNTVTGAWSQKADIPGEGRYGAVAFTLGTKAYVCLGANSTTELVDTYEYDTVANQWATKTPFPAQGRRFATAFGIGTRGYIGLGVTLGGSFTSAFYAFIPSENNGMGKWYTMPSFSSVGRHSAVGFTIGTKGYVGLGTLSSGVNTDEFYEYNPSTGQWTAKDDFDGGVRTGASCFVATTNKAYVGLGSDLVPAVMKSDFWEFDPTLGAGLQWTKVFDFIGAARTYATGFGVGTKGYVGAGITSDIDLKDFYILDPATNATVNMYLVTGWNIFSRTPVTLTKDFGWGINVEPLNASLSCGWDIKKYVYIPDISLGVGWSILNNTNYFTKQLEWNILGRSTVTFSKDSSWSVYVYEDKDFSLNIAWDIGKYVDTDTFTLDVGWDTDGYIPYDSDLECGWNVKEFVNTPDYELSCGWNISAYEENNFYLWCGWHINAYSGVDIEVPFGWNIIGLVDTDTFTLGCGWDLSGAYETSIEMGWNIFDTDEATEYFSQTIDTGWHITTETLTRYLESAWDIRTSMEAELSTGWEVLTTGKPRYEFDSEERYRVFKKEIIRKKQ